MTSLRQDPQVTRVASGYTIAGRTSSWLTPRQLVVVELHLVTEEYRRFDLSKIQALVLYRTRTGTVGSLLLLAGILLFATLTLVGMSTQAPEPVLYISGGATLLLAVSLVIHRWSGPTARLDIHTAVQRYTVPGIGRWRAGLRMLDLVAPAARAAQESPPAP